MGHEEWVIVARIAGALLIGSLIGFERSFTAALPVSEPMPSSASHQHY